MEFGILGPLAVWAGGRELPLAAPQQRTLLAILLLHAGEPVSAARLADDLWGEKPPATAGKAVRVRISELRKALGEGVIETHSLGYVLRVEDDALDAARFERLLEQGRRLLAEGAASEAEKTLEEALELWRGPALADFRYDEFARSETARLEELRVVALETRLEAALELGRHVEAVPELEGLVREHPLRERLRGLLILALYRSGRQADALGAYQDAKTTLVDELGLDPGQALQQLEKAILVQDPSLDLTTAAAALPAPVVPVAPPRADAAVAATAAPPFDPSSARAQRKVVTVLFTDVTGSTELGESLDPEALRALLAAYFERMKAAAERHGGVVEKFIGDAVMAVFGLPAVHEDDALRALRAAVEMRDAIAELGIEGSIGVESGEVVVGTAERLVTGHAVTATARLEQAAQSGEILLGEGTMQLAGEAVTAEPLEPLVMKGMREPVQAWRLVSVSAEAPVRHFDSPFVGREHELQTLSEAWNRVRADTRCELVTVVGTGGVGKSRLVAELLLQVDATAAHGRCLSYGAGITYWPVVEVLTQLRSSLDTVDPAIGDPLRSLLEDHSAVSTDELAWAFRKFVEAVSRERPLILVFDDIQWGEEALLDLIEHVAVVSSGASILLLCMARPDLLDRRPGWRGLLQVAPLTADEAGQLIKARLGERKPDAEVSQRIVDAAGGNPLFVEEIAAMLQESGDEQMAVPPTIQALLAARLDQLEEDERAVLEAAAVEGEVFHRGAVQALTPDEPRLTAQLTALVRKEFVRPDRAALEGEDGFRFRHLLVREATYDAIPKAARAGLHERYSEWLEQRSTGLDAFVGYHLEQAYRYRVELRDTGAESDDLARRASERLEGAATSALGRSDLRAAIGLLERAASLPPVAEGRRARLLTDLATTLSDTGELAEADRVLADAKTLADAAEDDCAQARMAVENQFLELRRAAPGAMEGVADVVEQVIPVFVRRDDQHGLCRARRLQATAEWIRCRGAAAAEAWEQAAEHARRSGEEHERAEILTWIASSTWFGAMPVEAGIRRCEEIQHEVRGHPTSEAAVLRHLGGLHGLAGRFELARSLFSASNDAFDDLGLELDHVLSHSEAIVDMLAGEFATAELQLRRGYQAYEAMGEKDLRSTTAALLARAILAQGRHDEAEQFTEVAEELAEPDDLATQILWRGVRARVLAARGLADDAEHLAREAVTLAERTDFIDYRADALIDLAAVLETDGRAAEASATIADAIALYEEKGNAVAAGAARAHLDLLAAV